MYACFKNRLIQLFRTLGVIYLCSFCRVYLYNQIHVFKMNVYSSGILSFVSNLGVC